MMKKKVENKTLACTIHVIKFGDLISYAFGCFVIYTMGVEFDESLEVQMIQMR